MSNVKELLDAGVHFGHQTRRWNPKMREFIFEARNGIHIIDLVQTVSQIETAAQFLTGIVSKGGKVLIVGTKKQAQATIKETAEATGQPYVCERWLGGMMTNLNTIKRSIKRMLELEAMESDGRMSEFVMQEQSMLRRELSRLHIRLNGIRDLSAKPDAIIIIDIKREHNALAEARRLGVPIVAIVDTNTDPTLVEYPIAGNDDAIRSIKVVLSAVTQPMIEARAAYEAAAAKLKAEAEAKAAKQEKASAEAEAAKAGVKAAPAPAEVKAPAAAPPSEVEAKVPAAEALVGDAPETPVEPTKA
ncbi:MAG: 30S ribosomal protein S2 [Verrucomicrobia bacterium]|nr:30S ribosomal protein S2 [Verrucomicrobiota bacterium]MBT7026367.1 30S ribosomal protein S2 [Verrucomicrobiota bacterium]